MLAALHELPEKTVVLFVFSFLVGLSVTSTSFLIICMWIFVCPFDIIVACITILVLVQFFPFACCDLGSRFDRKACRRGGCEKHHPVRWPRPRHPPRWPATAFARGVLFCVLFHFFFSLSFSAHRRRVRRRCSPRRRPRPSPPFAACAAASRGPSAWLLLRCWRRRELEFFCQLQRRKTMGVGP